MCARIYGEDVSFSFNFNRWMIESWRFFEVQWEIFILNIFCTNLLRTFFLHQCHKYFIRFIIEETSGSASQNKAYVVVKRRRKKSLRKFIKNSKTFFCEFHPSLCSTDIFVCMCTRWRQQQHRRGGKTTDDTLAMMMMGKNDMTWESSLAASEETRRTYIEKMIQVSRWKIDMFVMIWHAFLSFIRCCWCRSQSTFHRHSQRCGNIDDERREASFFPSLFPALSSRDFAACTNGFSIKNPHKFSLNFNSIIDVHCAR